MIVLHLYNDACIYRLEFHEVMTSAKCYVVRYAKGVAEVRACLVRHAQMLAWCLDDNAKVA